MLAPDLVPATPPAVPPPGFVGRAARVTPEGFRAAARANGLEPAVLRAVWVVECAGDPFLPDRRPAILFEAHRFSRITVGRFDRTHPDLSSPRWDRSLYSPTRAGEYRRLEAATRLVPDAALMACSWGGPQILGENHLASGFADVRAMVAAFCESEGYQLRAFLSFIRSRGLLDELRARDWAAFARGYNGPRFRENRYDEKLAAAHARLSAGAADGDLAPGDRGDAVRRLQATLNLLGAGLVADGVFGPATERALEAFQARQHLAVTGRADPATLAVLRAAAEGAA